MLKNLRLNWIGFTSSALFIAAILYVLGRKQGLDALIDVWGRIDPTSLWVAIILMLVVQGVSAYRVKIIANAENLSARRLSIASPYPTHLAICRLRRTDFGTI